MFRLVSFASIGSWLHLMHFLLAETTISSIPIPFYSSKHLLARIPILQIKIIAENEQDNKLHNPEIQIVDPNL